MAYIINAIGKGTRTKIHTLKLSCIENCQKRKIYDTNVIQQRIETAAKARQQLENETAVSNNSIEQSAQAKRNIDIKA